MSQLSRLIPRGWRTLRTIRVRLTLWYVALLAVILVLFSGVLYLGLARSMQAEADARLMSDTQQVLASVEIEGDRLDAPLRSDYMPAGLEVTLYNQRGQRLFTTDPDRLLPRLGREEVAAVRGPWRIDVVRGADGAGWRQLTGPVLEGSRQLGVVQTARPEAELTAALRDLGAVMALAIPATLLLASAGGLFLAGRALGPIDRMTRAAQAIGADDLTRRLDAPPVPDEVGRLALTFNGLLDRLERAFRRQRQFTTDAAHELRTPLAIMASQADVLLARPHPAAEYRQALITMRDDIARLTALVSELLTLARADAGQEALQRERLALTTLVDEVLTAMTPLAERASVRLRHDAGGGATVQVEGDQTRLTQLLINLLDNALTYTPVGGTVTVTVRPAGGWAMLAVADTGVGIAPEHLPHLFERFYRADAARARAGGGAGLGLAICQWVVAAHGGEIDVVSQPGQGTTVTVRLPLVAPLATESRATLAAGAAVVSEPSGR